MLKRRIVQHLTVLVPLESLEQALPVPADDDIVPNLHIVAILLDVRQHHVEDELCLCLPFLSVGHRHRSYIRARFHIGWTIQENRAIVLHSTNTDQLVSITYLILGANTTRQVIAYHHLTARKNQYQIVVNRQMEFPKLMDNEVIIHDAITAKDCLQGIAPCSIIGVNHAFPRKLLVSNNGRILDNTVMNNQMIIDHTIATRRSNQRIAKHCALSINSSMEREDFASREERVLLR